jgi:hypothetical protein
VLLVTATFTEQVPPAGITPPDSTTLPPPAAADTTPPAQSVAPFGVALFVKPAGYVSVSVVIVTAVVGLGLVRVIVKTDGSPTIIGFVEKPLDTVGGESTVIPLVVLELSPGVGSVTPAGGATVAVFAEIVPVNGAVAVIV